MQEGLLKGAGNGFFEPDRSVTRAEFVEMLVRFLALTQTGQCPFTDVGPDTWYHDSIAKACTAGLIDGMADGTFKPDAPLTREQLAVISFRVLSLTNLNTTVDSNVLERFQDKRLVSPWAVNACAGLVEKEILKGDNGYLKPQASAARAEAAVLLSRILDI